MSSSVTSLPPRGSAPKAAMLGPYFVLNWLYKPLLPEMRQAYGTRFVILLPTGGTGIKAKFEPFCGPADRFVEIPDFGPTLANWSATASDDDSAFPAAQRNERHYGVNYWIDIFQQERDLARGLVAGTSAPTFKSPKAASTAALARTANFYFDLYEKLIDEHGIDLALVWPRTAPEAICAAVAEKRGILVTYPYTAKHKDFAYWAAGAACGPEQHKAAYDALPECEPIPESEIRPPARPAYLEQSKIETRFSVATAVRSTAFNVLDYSIFFARDLKAGRIDRFFRRLPITTAIRNIWAERSYFKRFAELCEKDVARITDRPFVFFAFQNEPEFSVQMRCKDFNDQGAIVRQLALSLPAGVNLVIKEHTWLGGHDLNFYEQLRALPNVRMAHPGIRAIDLIPKALATASLAGTVTLEAALFGKPALIFSDRSEFAFMPGVHVVRDLGALAATGRDGLATAPAEREAIRRGAARMVKATEAIGFRARPLFTKEDSDVQSDDVQRAMRLLVELHQRRPDALKSADRREAALAGSVA